MTNPMAISTARSGARWSRTSHSSWANAPTIVGIARKNENSAAAARSSRMTSPPTIVAPERDTPGISASVWHDPDAERARDRRLIGLVHVRRRPEALDEQHDDAADDERRGDDAQRRTRRVVEPALDEVREQHAGDRRRDERDDDSTPRTAAPSGSDGSRDTTRDDLRAIQPHHRQDRSELDHHGEHAARIVEAEQLLREQQMRRRRNRQELGQSLDRRPSDARRCR